MVDDVVSAVKAKRELRTLNDDFVREKVVAFLAAHPDVKEKRDASRGFAQFSRSKEYALLLKAVRKELRAVYGVFQEAGREKLLAARDAKGILASHTSTRERLPYYDAIYAQLAAHGWRPYIIASDISSADMAFLEKAFRAFGIPGTAFATDLVKDYHRLDEIEADVTFMFKLVDSLEEAERHITYRIMERLRSEYVVVSFPTRSLGGGKRISSRGRAWFERLLQRQGRVWETFEVENELLYVIGPA